MIGYTAICYVAKETAGMHVHLIKSCL